MLRHLVLIVSLTFLVGFALMFGYGALVAMSGHSAFAPIVGSLVIAYIGIGLMYWWQRLDYAYSLRRYHR